MPDHPPGDFADIFSAPELPTVIGGQAVNLWAEYYSSKAPELSHFRPFVSRDADLWADRPTAISLCKRSGWQAMIYNEPRTHAVGFLTKEVPGQPDNPLKVEILKDVHGLTPQDFQKSSILSDSSGKAVRILDPAVLLKGKIATLYSFGEATRPRDARHIQILLPISRVFLGEQIAAARSGARSEREVLAAVRYTADLTRLATAQALANKHGFNFAASLPAFDDLQLLPKLQNFVKHELARILAANEGPRLSL